MEQTKEPQVEQQSPTPTPAAQAAPPAPRAKTVPPSLPMVRPGERALLLSHREYTRARALGQGVSDYDLLMRQPQDADEDGADEVERWMPVRADKYLKHRAIGYREAASLSELPTTHRAGARERGAFSTGRRSSARRRTEG